MTLYTQGNVDYQQMKNYKVYLLLSWTLGSFSQFCPSYAHRDYLSDPPWFLCLDLCFTEILFW